MKITKKTKWVAFAPFANEERLAQLREKITDCAIFDFWGLTIGDFSEMLEGKYPTFLQKKLENKDVTVDEVVTIINATEKFLLDFKNVMSSFEIEMEAEERQAATFMPEFTAIESMLIFTQKYFSLPDFGSAEKITLIEFALAKKSDYSNAIFQRKITKIQTAKYK